MATYSFTSSQSIGSPGLLTFNDTSIGLPGGLTERRIELRLANGNYLTLQGESQSETWESWPIANSSITLNLLNKSTVANVTILWMTGATETGTSSVITCYDEFDYLFAYSLIGDLTSQPDTAQDTNYYSNFNKFLVNLLCAETAVSVGNDLYSGQAALDRNFFLIQNEATQF